VPRGPADRPIRAGDDEVALQAAVRRALEQAAAPAIVRFTVPDPPSFGTGVAPTAAIRGGSGVVRSRGVRAAVGVRRIRKKGAARAEPIPDPRRRGEKIDFRV